MNVNVMNVNVMNVNVMNVNVMNVNVMNVNVINVNVMNVRPHPHKGQKNMHFLKCEHLKKIKMHGMDKAKM